MRRETDQETNAQSGATRFLRLEVISFVIQTITLIAALVYGYTRLEAKVEEINRRLTEHVDRHGVFLLRETWETRNLFIDKQLGSIERKLDLLLEQRKVK